MQSTKKAPLRKEDGTTAAGEDVATIAQTAGPNTTQPVNTVLYKYCVRSFYCGILVFLFWFPASLLSTYLNIAVFS